MARSGEQNGGMVYPDEAVLARAGVEDLRAVSQAMLVDMPSAWAEIARTQFEWYEPWHTTLDESNAPFYQWFVGGKTNIVLNALDRHVRSWRRNKAALIWEGENYETRTYTYQQLNREVSRFASVLRAMGVNKGDRVTIYMGRIPEIEIAMLACAKLGAVHSVVYGGFSVEALHGRIEDSQSRIAITADGAWLRGNVVPLKDIMDEALQRAPTIQTVIVVKRTGQDVHMEPGRDLWYHDLMNLPIADAHIETVPVDAEDPLYLLYTSGTTGAPKAILHTHGGYMVGVAATLKWVFDVQDDDTWWCAADPGWVTGHSYIIYGPLLLGATSLMYEGAPNYPFPDRWWDIAERHGVTILYTAPTAIRGLMRFGDAWPNRHDLSKLRLLGSVGEPINPEAWRWYHRVIGKDRCPIMDTWWQTETGTFMISPVPATPLKPGSATLPLPGVEVDVLNEEGDPAGLNEEGYLVIKRPWPGMMRTIYGDPERYINSYWSRFPGVYMTGDSARRDEDGYIWVIGRVDDVIKVSGYRLGTAEIESALVSHRAVAEAAVIGVPDEVRGHVIKAYCILITGVEPTQRLVEELRDHVAHEVGPIAKPATIEFVETLPKTRSGKIMRRVLKARVLGQDEGDTSTLEQ